MEESKENSTADSRTYIGRAVLVLSISLGIALADQLVKAIVVRQIPLDTVGVRLWNDWLWIVHTRNLGIAFSIGEGLSRLIRIGFFIVLPSCFLVVAFVFCLKSKSLNKFQRVAIAIVAGGGLGNLIDRIFRPDGVVDFLSFSLFGIFGFDRFPTFNIADNCVTVGAGLILISGLLLDKGGKNVQRR
ncbi:MAG: signal peptidase II [Spirochaetes bacterium]|nr:signal peptidase II [Spirochaetota bacterium]